MSITTPEGFLAGGINCGIKENGNADLALVVAEDLATSAAVFTTNKVQAAPVLTSKKHLKESKQKTKAVILNSGCANAATGETGAENSKLTCEKTAEELNVSPEEILVCSTGLIGFQLPIQKILGGINELAASISKAGGTSAAKAIMTTDTHPKEHLTKGEGFSVGGMAKGAAMLAPNMATMLAVITTDATCQKPAKNLQKILQSAVADSFNRMSVDGVQSTNDTVILLASGKAGVKPPAQIQSAITQTCQNLAYQMVKDAEGSTKAVKVHISGAANKTEAEYAARYLADSMLVKCSWHGGDPYWGRLASELGAAGIDVNLEKLSLAYGEHKVLDNTLKNGNHVEPNQSALAEYMSGDHLDVFVELGNGTGEGYILTCDLGHGYIDENSKTS